MKQAINPVGGLTDPTTLMEVCRLYTAELFSVEKM